MKEKGQGSHGAWERLTSADDVITSQERIFFHVEFILERVYFRSKVILTSESVDAILQCDHSNEIKFHFLKYLY